MNELKTIIDKVAKGTRLSKEEGLALFLTNDILALGKAAHAAKKKKSGDHIFFNVNCHINLTNLCIARCKFCAFSCEKDAPGAYTFTAEDVIEKVSTALPAGITEAHIVSGLHPDLPFNYYVDIVCRLKRKFPAVHIKAFTPVEIKYFSDISGLTIEDVLNELKEGGLGSLPGGGAEVLSRRVRQELCPKKATFEDWLEVMKISHRLGFKSNATLLYGHIETEEEIIDHLVSLRTLQDETGGFQTFIPLPFHSANTMMRDYKKPTAYEQLKMISIARLMLDNFDHIKAYWVMAGMKVAQLALHFGADDIDGTIVEEKITHAAGADTAGGVAENELISLIKQAGFVPVQRDTLYNIIETY